MGGPNLEVFKFGMYIMFPIGIMYYFGTNLDEKFSVPGFWPSKEETHKIPYDRKEIEQELERLRTQRLAARARRMEAEGRESTSLQGLRFPEPSAAPGASTAPSSNAPSTGSKGWFSVW